MKLDRVQWRFLVLAVMKHSGSLTRKIGMR